MPAYFDHPKTRHLVQIATHLARPAVDLLTELGAFAVLLLGAHFTWPLLSLQGVRTVSAVSKLCSAWKEWKVLNNSRRKAA